jgi:hypothetical protein
LRHFVNSESNPMATKLCAKLCETQASSLEPTRKSVPSLRYDNLSSVLINLDKQGYVPGKRKRDRKSGVEAAEFTELRAQVASLKAENELLAERLTDEVDRLAERITELETRANRPWWRRTFGTSGPVPEPAGRPRSKAIARLRALSSNRAAAEYQPS